MLITHPMTPSHRMSIPTHLSPHSLTRFNDQFPAREAIEVVNLPLGANIEISAIASK